jgi:hypothetical protein
MRLSRAATAGLVVLAVVAIAGTGFAAFTSTAYVNGSAVAGTLGPMIWGPDPAYGGFQPNDVCDASVGTTHITSDTLFLTASNFLPGDICSYGDNLNNLGSLPATVSEQITSASGSLCTYLAFGDNFFSPAVTIGSGGQTSGLTHTIPAGSYIQWAGFIHLLPSTPPSVGGSCAFTVTLTGTAGT